MGWKKEVAAYFHFTKRDRVAILVIVVLIIVVWAFPRLRGPHRSASTFAGDTSWFAAVRKLERTREPRQPGNRTPEPWPGRAERPFYPGSPRPAPTLFPFDPNTATREQWEQLGLREKTISTILHFRSKGGRFRKAEDLKKIYGLFPDEYARLAPYVIVREEGTETETETERVVHRVDINGADSAAWVALPGIGSKLAGRILLFRQKLGGFYSVDQVGETFGLADSVFEKIKPLLSLESAVVRKININAATVEELRVHPYFRHSLAQAIVAYRNEHGPFERPEDLGKLAAVTESLYQKIVAYITVK